MPVRPAGKSEEGKAGEAVAEHSSFTERYGHTVHSPASPEVEQAVRVATGLSRPGHLNLRFLSSALTAGRMLPKEER